MLVLFVPMRPFRAVLVTVLSLLVVLVAAAPGQALTPERDEPAGPLTQAVAGAAPGRTAVGPTGDDGTATAQRRLNALGCAAGPVDGRHSIRLRAALVRLQAADRLPQSGRLDAATRSLLAAPQPVRCDRRPVPGADSGRRVVVSQGQNYVWLVGRAGRVVAEGPVIDNPAVLHPGRYRTGSQCGRAARIRANSDYSGRYRLESFVRFAPCGVGFHRVPVDRGTGRQLHSDRLLGTDLRRSHGCLRVSRTLSQAIWGFATPGTRVLVRR